MRHGNGNTEYLRQVKGAVSLADLGAVAKPSSLFDGLLLKRTVTIVGGEPFAGKTMFLLAMAVSLDSGRALLGKFQPAFVGRTLFIGQDAPTWDYQAQATKLMRGYGLTPEEISQLTTDLVLNANVKLTDPAFWHSKGGWLDEYYYSFPFDVVMFDTLANFHDLPENDSGAMTRLGEIVKGIRDHYGCAVVLSHHVGKPSEAMRSPIHKLRGGSAIGGWVDYYLELTARGGTVRLAMHKGRGAENVFAPVAFKIEGREAVVLVEEESPS